MLTRAAALDLVLKPPDLSFAPIAFVVVRNLGVVECVVLGQAVVIVHAQSFPDTGHVVRAHAGESLRVDATSLILEDDLCELRAERLLALLLENEGFERLRPPPLTCDRAAVHAARIIAV